MHTLGPSDLALATWALGRMGLRLRPDFAARLLSCYQDRLAAADPRALALMAHGLAACGCRPEGLWAGVFLVKVQQLLPRFKGQDMAMLLWGLVRMR